MKNFTLLIILFAALFSFTKLQQLPESILLNEKGDKNINLSLKDLLTKKRIDFTGRNNQINEVNYFAKTRAKSYSASAKTNNFTEEITEIFQNLKADDEIEIVIKYNDGGKIPKTCNFKIKLTSAEQRK